MKTLLILVDGMRPDAIANNPRVQKLLTRSAYTLRARTVEPSVTLPCHVSLFHSVEPFRHGTVTNVYTPQVRPVNGICEVLAKYGEHSAFFYNWEELRDLTRPDSLDFAYFRRGRSIGYDKANIDITDAAIRYLNENPTSFAFIYFGYTDMAGHRHGWMSEEYMQAIENSLDCIDRLMTELSDDYTFIITADHGGHDRTHGTDLPEDMLIPVIIAGSAVGTKIVCGEIKKEVSILDLAPTVTALLGKEADAEWEGKSIL